MLADGGGARTRPSPHTPDMVTVVYTKQDAY
jgi:hypothetical protein